MDKEEKLIDVLNSLTPEVRNVIEKVIFAERRKLHLRNPRGIYDDIRHIIQQEAEQRET